MPAAPFPNELPPHPRIFLTPERVRALRAQIAPGGDPVSARLFARISAGADADLPQKTSTRVMEGRRLLTVTRRVLSRVFHLGLVAVLTDSERHARRAIDEMLASAGFSDWNPSHYLDTAEITLALAVGYDWLHGRMTPDEREQVEHVILDKGLRTSLADTKENHWIDGTNNWTQVCHAGMAAGALALAELDRALAERLVRRAIEKAPRAAGSYAPDGAYAEGTMYWGYGTGFHVMLIDLLTTALGHDGGLADGPGFLASARDMRPCTPAPNPGAPADSGSSEPWREHRRPASPRRRAARSRSGPRRTGSELNPSPRNFSPCNAVPPLVNMLSSRASTRVWTMGSPPDGSGGRPADRQINPVTQMQT